MEVELKLLLTEHAVEAFRRHRLLKAYSSALPHELTQHDTYFDTPDQRLRHSDAGLRVRRSGANSVQTLKAGGAVHGGLHSRHEWESRVSGPGPDLAELRQQVEHNSPWGRLLRSPVVEDRLLPIFKVHVKRTVWLLRLPQGDQIECALDLGDIDCEGRTLPVCEIELELKLGDPLHLFDFALALLADVPMHIGQLSKAERGYALYAPQAPQAVKATPVALTPRMDVERAFGAIVVNCLGQVQANAGAVVHEHDVESLHQMRVGVRRLRAALGLFAPVLATPDDLQQELAWLTEQLGAARDWDVLAGVTLPAVMVAAPHETGLDALLREVRQRAHASHTLAAGAVDATRYTGLVLGFARWAQGNGWRDAMTASARRKLTRPVAKFAGALMQQRQRRLLERGKSLRDAAPETRHRVRIAAKKTRYAIEFFQPLYGAKKLARYVQALTQLQDELGWLNDAVVADTLLRRLHEEQPALAASIGFVRGYLSARAEHDNKRVGKLWDQLARMKLAC